MAGGMNPEFHFGVLCRKFSDDAGRTAAKGRPTSQSPAVNDDPCAIFVNIIAAARPASECLDVRFTATTE